jgi:biotin transporter BioY
MEPNIAKAIEQAQELKLTASAVWNLCMAFLLGSFTSAWWTLREGGSPGWKETTSSCIVSGMVATAIGALLMDYGISPLKLVFVSIMCGFSGDIIIRVAARRFVAFVKKLLEP